jgi:AcrR family transcriptional regulator
MPKNLSDREIAEFRARLCDAAAALFAQKGHADFTLREVARALNVSAMTPYRYFRDKDEMLAAMRARAFAKFAEALETAYRSGGSDGRSAVADANARATAEADAYVRFALADPVSYKLMFDVTQPDSGEYPELEEAAERARQTMTHYVHPLIEAGIFGGDPELIGHVFWAVLHGAVMLHLAGKLGPDYDLSRIVAGALDALAAGFGPPASAHLRRQ